MSDAEKRRGAAGLMRIGEAARLFGVSVSSLRHYEKLGILEPEYTDPDSGYRYYGVRQFEILNTVRYLRVLGTPLGEIADFVRSRDVPAIEELLLRQREDARRRISELTAIERKIDRRLSRLRDAQDPELGAIKLVRAQACRMARLETTLHISGYLDMEGQIRRLVSGQSEPIVFLGKIGASISEGRLLRGEFDEYDGIFIVLDDEDSFTGETLTLPECDCVRVRFRGSHTASPEQYARLMSFLSGNSLEPCGFSREITLIDNGFTSDEQRFVTEIAVPVRQGGSKKPCFSL